MTTPVRRRALLALAAVVVTLGAGSPAYADNIRDAQWQLGFLRISEAQRLADSGAGVTVAVIDTGVDATHQDLTGNILPGADLTNPAGGDGHTDTQGHGTAMAGLIAGHGHDRTAGALGIAPKAKILPVRVMESDSVLGAPEAEGITWAVEHGAKVISISLGSPGDDPQVRHAIEQALAADVVVIAGAGNRPKATAVNYPAAYPGVIAVGGIDQQGNLADVSVTGPEISLVGPAVDVVTTQTGDRYSRNVGTSEATAIVAGVAALLRARYPQMPATEVTHRLTATATDKGTPSRDDEYGYGIVNPVAALTADIAPLAPSSAPPTASPAGSASPDPVPADKTAAHPSDRSTALTIKFVGYCIFALAAAVAVGDTIAGLARRRRKRSKIQDHP